MSPSTRSIWTSMAILSLLVISTVQAQPVRESTTKTAAQPVSNIEPREPRLIPGAEHYLADVFRMLGVSDPDPSPSIKPTPTTPIFIKAEHGKPENLHATPVVSSTTTATTHPASAAFTTTVRHGDKKPIENIQIGSGWKGGKKLRAEDLPVVFGAVEMAISQRFRDLIDSSDEVGLGDDEGLLDYLR